MLRCLLVLEVLEGPVQIPSLGKAEEINSRVCELCAAQVIVGLPYPQLLITTAEPRPSAGHTWVTSSLLPRDLVAAPSQKTPAGRPYTQPYAQLWSPILSPEIPECQPRDLFVLRPLPAPKSLPSTPGSR